MRVAAEQGEKPIASKRGKQARKIEARGYGARECSFHKREIEVVTTNRLQIMGIGRIYECRTQGSVS